MEIKDFEKAVAALGYIIKKEDDKIIVEHNGSIYLANYYDGNRYKNLTSIPDNVVFRTDKTVVNSYVQIPYLTKLPATTVFEEVSDVHLPNNIEIPKGFKGFKNFGNIYPENFKIKKPIPYYYLSTFFVNFLNEINKDGKNRVAKFILNNFNNKLVNPELLNASFIDCSNDKSEMISYISADKLLKQYIAYNKEFVEKNVGKQVPQLFSQWCQTNFNKLYESTERSRIKIGRFLKKIMPDVTDVEIEEFVNKYKSMKTIDDYEFVIVRGNDIHKCYDRVNQDCATSSSLYNSCRNYSSEKDPKYLDSPMYKYCDFYASTPETCGLLILKYNGEDKIRGRAFIWNTEDGKVFVDYAYTSTAVEANMYQQYIKKNGYSNGSTKGITIKVNQACRALTPRIPYLDSFTYDEKTDTLKSKY